MTAAELAQQIGVSEEVVNGAAKACASRLAEWFGSAEAAADALRGSPVETVGIALADHVKTTKRMAAAAHKQPVRTAQAVLEMINSGAAH